MNIHEFFSKQMELENIILGEVTQKDTCGIYSLIRVFSHKLQDNQAKSIDTHTKSLIQKFVLSMCNEGIKMEQSSGKWLTNDWPNL